MLAGASDKTSKMLGHCWRFSSFIAQVIDLSDANYTNSNRHQSYRHRLSSKFYKGPSSTLFHKNPDYNDIF